MSTRHRKSRKLHKGTRSRKMRGGKKIGGKEVGGKEVGKKWTTAIEAAESTLKHTGSISAAKKSLRKQALSNARKLFGSI